MARAEILGDKELNLKEFNIPLFYADTEVFKDWHCLAYAQDDGEVVLIESGEDFSKAFKEFRKGIILAHNFKGYDGYTMEAMEAGKSPQAIFWLSKEILSDNKPHIPWWGGYTYFDTLDGLPQRPALKLIEANFGVSIEESPANFDEPLLPTGLKDDVVKYCKNDVKELRRFVKESLLSSGITWYDTIKCKAFLADFFGFSIQKIMSWTLSRIGSEICRAAKNYKPPIEDSYNIPDKIADWLIENVQSEVLEFAVSTPMSSFTKKFELFDNEVNLGVGGIHSVYADTFLDIASNSEIQIWDIDFANLYPRLIRVFDYFPRSVPTSGKRNFNLMLDILQDIYDYPEEWSEEEKITIPKSFKLILNAFSGDMRNKFSKSYDPDQIMQLCITGQLITIGLANLLTKMGATVIQTNTDGILFFIAKTKEQEMRQLIKETVQFFEIGLKVEKVDHIWQWNVNNYISIVNGKTKRRGDLIGDRRLKDKTKPLDFNICAQAVVDYLTLQIPIEETIRNGKHLIDYCMSFSRGVYHHLEDANGNILPNKVNRVYASTDNKYTTIYKVDPDRKAKVQDCPSRARVVNFDIREFGRPEDLDYDFYIERAQNLLEEA